MTPTGKRNAIALCTDRNMIVQALFVAHAVLAQATPAACPFDVVIVTDDQAAGPDETAFMSRHGIIHRIIDFQSLREIFDTSVRLTTATLVKLTLAQIFAGDYGRILYLDTDLTIHADLSVLFALDLGGHAIAANRRAVMFPTEENRRETEDSFRALGMSPPFRFFNAGVLLIDVAAWNAQDLTARSLDFISRNRELCKLPDEHGLNAVLDGRFAALSPAWNMPPRRWPFMQYYDHVEPAIVHYSGRDKPWKRFGYGKPLFPDGQAHRLYRDFIASSPWPGWLKQQWSAKDLRAGLTSGLRGALQDYRTPSLDRARAATFRTQLGAYLAAAPFADVEQGLVLRHGDRLTLRRGGLPAPSSTPDRSSKDPHMNERGCVFFNFGSAYALRLLVAIHSLRQHYAGPITVLAVHDRDGNALKAELDKLDVTTSWVDALSKSSDRHMLFLNSPYRSTLNFDSDLIFRAPIDPLWQGLEEKGVLVTRFYAPPYGLHGSPADPRGRMGMLPGMRPLLDDELYDGAVRRITRDSEDVNIGVLGISSPRGDAFLEELAMLIEKGRNQRITLLDEFAVLALLERHDHVLEDEIWNCPAHEIYRRTNLRDAKVIHYFADGSEYRGLPVGRCRTSWAGLLWFDAYESAAKDLDLPKWVARDPLFTGKRK